MSEQVEPLTPEEIEKVRKRSQLASMVDARVVRDLLATIDALKAELRGARAERRHASDLVDRAHQQCDLAGIKGLPGAELVTLPERVERLRAQIDALTAERDRLKQAIREIDRLYEAGDTLQLRSLLANLREEIGT